MAALEGWKGSTRGWQIFRADMARRGGRSGRHAHAPEVAEEAGLCGVNTGKKRAVRSYGLE
jgi:general stress protein YciG